MSKTENQNGFSIIEIILGIVVVLVIGVAIYYAYHAHHTKASVASKVAATATPTPAAHTAPTPSPLASVSARDAATLVSAFYAQYYKAAADSARLSVVTQNGTPKLLAAYNAAQGADPILCSQNDPTQAPSVIGESAAGDAANVLVYEEFAASSQQIAATVVSDEGKLKVDAVSCSIQ